MQEEKAQEKKTEKQCKPATAASSASSSRQHGSGSMNMEEHKREGARCGSHFGSRSRDAVRGLCWWLRLWLWVFVLISVDLGCGAGAGAEVGLGFPVKSDVEALLEFKRGISEDPKGILNGWSNGNSPCHWYGVRCSQFRVRSLNLSNAGISGTVQAYSIMSRMDKLDALVLRGNNISGALDSSENGLGVCSVSVLDLSNNKLSGGLDLGFLSSSCQRLVYLNLSFNSFTIAAASSKGKNFSLPSIRVLDLSHNSLSGETPLPQILSCCCDNLQHLDVSFNNLNGSIPLGIGSRCKQLVSLNLSANSLEAEIPADLIVSSNRCSDSSSSSSFEANCSGQPPLQVLDLSSNFLSGDIPLWLGICKQLKVLNLSANKLSGEIPAAVGGLTSLEQLLISKNNLNGKIPVEIANSCACLKELNLSYNNNLTGSIPWTFNSCTSLQTMDLSHNQLVGAFPEMLVSGLWSLRVLQLSFNNITGPVPISLTNSSNTLQILDLSSNRISGDISDAICSPSSSLQKLLLANNLLTGPVPAQIANCQNLQSLDLSFNMLHGTIPAHLGALPHLRDLVLWFNKLEGEIPQSICNSGSLETLILNSNSLTGPVPEALANCPNLIWISLSSNRLSGRIPPSLGRLKKLAILQLDNNSLSGPIPPQLGNCSSLIWLDLNSNLLNGSVPETLSMNSGHIVAGNVSGKDFAFIRNQFGSACRGAGGLLEFAGIRPEQLNKTPMVHSCEYTRVYYGTTVYRFQDNGSLIYLDLSYNSLSGIIPETFGSMYYMEILDLAHNQISGEIPSSLGNMKEAAVVDLSHNKLYGFIPGSFGGLSFLTDLDVSNNNLSGPIPLAGQLTTFPASRYANNSGLCGMPLPGCGSLSDGANSEAGAAGDSNHHSSESNRRNGAMAASIALGLLLAMLCVAGLIYIAARSRKEKKQEEMRDRYMDSLPTSGSGSWKLSGVAEPLSINVATFEKPLRKLTFAHLLEATNGFSADSLIGSGGFGDVYKAQLKDGTVVAIKKLIHVSGQGDREFTAEMETIGKIKHRNLVPLLGYCKVGDERLLVYEYMKWGSLDTVLHDTDQGCAILDWAARKKIAIGSARGLAFLHHSCIPHIIHRDMKSSNVLLDENMEPRVSDFGMARLMNALDTHLSVTSLAGTPGYVPPEYYQSFRCSTKGDVYSYGVILLELLSGRRPIDSETFGDTNLVGWMKHNVKLKKASLVFDPVLMEDMSRSRSTDMDLYHHLRIACRCLDDCPWRRPTMIQVMTMFRDAAAAAADPEAETDLDIITLPEDLDDDVNVREESSSSTLS